MKRARDVAVEAHRRALWQVLGIYLVAAWIGYQVILAITDGVGLPDWVPAVAIVLFIIGLPIVLATAFVHEGAPSAVRFEADPTLLPDVHVARVQRVRAVLTWRRALLGGALAFAALGLSAGSYMGLRSAGIGPFGSLVAANAMLPREPVLLTAFAATDTALADLVTEALRVDLEQSTSVALVPAARVAESLVRMRRPATARVDEAL